MRRERVGDISQHAACGRAADFHLRRPQEQFLDLGRRRRRAFGAEVDRILSLEGASALEGEEGRRRIGLEEGIVIVHAGEVDARDSRVLDDVVVFVAETSEDGVGRRRGFGDAGEGEPS